MNGFVDFIKGFLKGVGSVFIDAFDFWLLLQIFISGPTVVHI